MCRSGSRRPRREKAVVEERAHVGILASLEGRAGELLLLASRFERGARLVDLLFGDGLVVELDAGAPAAIGARPVVKRRAQVWATSRRIWPARSRGLCAAGRARASTLKEAEGALDMSLVLRAKRRGADAERDVAERGVDLVRCGWRACCRAAPRAAPRRVVATPSASASVTAALSSSSRTDMPTKPSL